jgi:hypothetical protein
MTILFSTMGFRFDPKEQIVVNPFLKESKPLTCAHKIFAQDPLKELFSDKILPPIFYKNKEEESLSYIFKSVENKQISLKRTSDEVEIGLSKKRRRVLSYNTNITSSRRASESELFETEPVKCSSQDLWNSEYRGECLRDRIKDHALRRVSIFYYILVVYYKQEFDVELGPTLLQHGKTVCGKCHAAHSSIIPNLQDNFYMQVIQAIEKDGVTEEVESHLDTLMVPDSVKEKIREKPNSENALRILNSHFSETPSLISKESHLYQTMNSTIELLSVINRYDCIIERVLRPRALELLNKVSKEALSPYSALAFFVEELNTFFDTSERQIQEKEKVLNLIKEEEEAIFIESTHYSTDPKVIKKDQIISIVDHIFKIKKLLNEAMSLSGYSPSLNKKDVFASYNEIYQLVNKKYYIERKKMFSISNVIEMKSLINKMIENTPEHLLNCVEECFLNYTEDSFITELRSRIKNLLKKISFIDFVMIISNFDSAIHEKILEMNSSRLTSENVSLNLSIIRLKESKEVIQLQREATLLPRLELLSGKIVSGVLQPFNEEELLSQQRDIIHTKSLLYDDL